MGHYNEEDTHSLFVSSSKIHFWRCCLINQNYNEHYAAMTIQPIEVMQAIMSHEELIGFLKGNIIKYSMRAGHKEGESAAKDAAKAKHYSKWLSSLYEDGFINTEED